MPRHEPVSLTRDVEAVHIPSGERGVLAQGSWVVVQQTLGGDVTVLAERGGLARIAQADADALGPEYADLARKAAEAGAARLSGDFDEARVWEQLGTVFDPEIPASIVELGLVYLVASEPLPEGGHQVLVRMTLTAPGCGVGPMLLDDVQRKVLAVPGVRSADVQLVFDPPWDQSMMSEAAKLQLGLM
ncbi:putative Fe-S cluster assembly protein SufT [Anaeromyxobacter paludicola]|uniref:Fe-S cluster assembly protein SufT n=1 Tax=Anaeromyxobacter paludicola TaxID=2918171 RepID=A0ABN6NDV1_9BACT|nr:putative Fe-S cluster assembly protein SufT [Anaeromyxobacter paludicola]BDG10645.1 putative Fe-S cluster assembly protein SufT [Anaeromyxobacter paludicola]